MNAAAKHCEYTRAETIKELDGYLNHGRRMYGIDTAISAVHWLKLSDNDAPGLASTIAALEFWLADETPNLPDSIAAAALDWLQETRT